MDKNKMTTEARNVRNAYYREWRARNRDKVKQSNERYWAKKAQEAGKQIVVDEKKLLVREEK